MDIVEQLRDLCPHDVSGYCGCTAQQAADEIGRLRAELAEWHKLKDPIALHQNLLRGVPARLTESMKVHLLGEHGVAALKAQQGCDDCSYYINRGEPSKEIAAMAFDAVMRDKAQQDYRDAFMRGYDMATLLQQQQQQEPVAWLPSPEWQACTKLPVTVHVRGQRKNETHVSTREGITPIKPDDLIMRGVQGEEYPIGREIFERTYRMGEATPPNTEALKQARDALKIAASQVAVLGGTPDPSDPNCDRIQVEVQEQLREALAAIDAALAK